MRHVRSIGCFAFVLIASVASACTPQVVVTEAGERITGISLEEHYALTTDVRESTFRGDTLKKMVASMDKHGVFSLTGTYEARGVLDDGSVIVVIRTADDRERRIVVKNCMEPHLCEFLGDALADGSVHHKPSVCRTQNVCEHANEKKPRPNGDGP